MQVFRALNFLGLIHLARQLFFYSQTQKNFHKELKPVSQTTITADANLQVVTTANNSLLNCKNSTIIFHIPWLLVKARCICYFSLHLKTGQVILVKSL